MYKVVIGTVAWLSTVALINIAMTLQDIRNLLEVGAR